MLADSILLLSWGNHSGHTDQEQSFEESFEEVICVDNPESSYLINGCVEFEQNVCQNLQVVADSV